MPFDGAGQILEIARTARGLTQVELSRSTGISQAALSKLEADALTLDDDRAALIARELDVPLSLLTRNVGGGARIYHRKRASLPITADKRIRANALLLSAQISALLGDRKPELKLVRNPLPPDRYYTPADRAREVREELGLGTGPIGNLVDVLEEAGVLILQDDLRSIQVDAIAVWPDQGAPVVFLAKNAPATRQRFTAAHELGHAILHEIPSSNQEREADEFAAEFLMPRKSVIPDLDDLSFAHLVELKAKWGASIAALARRAVDLNKMSEQQYRVFNMQMASSGMNRLEPGELPTEKPTLVAQFVQNNLRAGRTIDDLANDAAMTPASFVRQYEVEAS